MNTVQTTVPGSQTATIPSSHLEELLATARNTSEGPQPTPPSADGTNTRNPQDSSCLAPGPVFPSFEELIRQLAEQQQAQASLLAGALMQLHHRYLEVTVPNSRPATRILDVQG